MTNDPPARLCANRVWFKCCHQRHATVPPSASSCQSDHRCLHSTGHIPYIQTVLHTLHSSSTPASPAAFIFFVVPFPGVFPVFADASDSPTYDRSISGSRMWCAETSLSPVATFGFSRYAKQFLHACLISCVAVIVWSFAI